VIWEKKYSPQNDAKWLSDSHDFILVYAKNKRNWKPNLLPRTDEMNKRYKNPDNDSRGVWKTSDLSVKRVTAKDIYEIITPTGRVVMPPSGRSWSVSQEKFKELVKDNRIWFGVDGNSVPQLKRFITDVKDGIIAMTLWKYVDVGHNQDAKKEAVIFNSNDPFATPKPERLIERILTLATKEGDLVLDSFLGSGTTVAVAHKMGRKWIGIELGEHAYTHCIPRLKAVIDGEQGGISKSVGWQGGGGFKFYKLAPTLLEPSGFGFLVLSDKYNHEMLSQAMAKHEGYTYAPDENVFWKQGHSGDNNFIFTATGHISPQYLDNISSQLGENEYLLICSESFDTECVDRCDNILVRHIPRMLLGRCEWGKDNYDLNISEDDNDDD
jgi:adenine-specific DNA-methyltransferase